MTRVIIIIKSEVWTLPIVIKCFRGFVPEMFVTSYAVTYCIYIPGKPGFCFIIIVQFMMSSSSQMRFGLQIVFVCLCIQSHYHHCAKLSEDIDIIKCLSDIFVWVRLSIFSQLSILQYMGLCVFSLRISFVMIERIYTLCCYHHSIGSMTYYPLFRARSWNNGVRCMSLYIVLTWLVKFKHYHLVFKNIQSRSELTKRF